MLRAHIRSDTISISQMICARALLLRRIDKGALISYDKEKERE